MQLQQHARDEREDLRGHCGVHEVGRQIQVVRQHDAARRLEPAGLRLHVADDAGAHGRVELREHGVPGEELIHAGVAEALLHEGDGFGAWGRHGANGRKKELFGSKLT